MSRKISLRTLLVLLSVGGVTVTALLLLYGLYFFQKKNIEESLMSRNIAYARKLADVTDSYFIAAQRELAYSARQIVSLQDAALLKDETERLRVQSAFFNSAVVVNADAVIRATSPDSLRLVGVKVSSQASKQAISSQKTLISKPFISIAGNYIIALSQPIFSPEGQYLGYISGNIYLKKDSMLSELLRQHYYTDSSEISIVNDGGEVIFNHDPALISENIITNSSLQKELASTQSGKFHFRYASQDYMLGYASLKSTDWNIFIYGSSDIVTQILMRTAKNVFWYVLAITALMSLLVTMLSSKISAPLRRLADITRTEDSVQTLQAIPAVQGWYLEADKLKHAIYHYVLTMSGRMRSLSDAAMTDPLTGLLNRRGFYLLAKEYLSTHNHSVIALDLDHFKNVNDCFGHDAGDAVLREMSALIKSQCSSTAIISRFGGEEFIIFIPATGQDEAARTAERIRMAAQHTVFAHVGEVTLSAGVAQMSSLAVTLEAVIFLADEALYKAKTAGRNKIVVSNGVNTSEYR